MRRVSLDKGRPGVGSPGRALSRNGEVRGPPCFGDKYILSFVKILS